MQLEAFTAKVHTARLLVFWVVLYLDLCLSLSQRIKYTANCPPDIFTSVFYMGKMSKTSNTRRYQISKSNEARGIVQKMFIYSTSCTWSFPK